MRPVAGAKSRWPLPVDRWHYTIGLRWEAIVKSGYIKLSTAAVDPKERKVAWFSRDPVWEPTAHKRLLNVSTNELEEMTKPEVRRQGHGLYRIGVTAREAPHDWEDYVRMSGIEPLLATSLVEIGLRDGADPKNWYCSFEPVLRQNWHTTELWFNEEWIPVKI